MRLRIGRSRIFCENNDDDDQHRNNDDGEFEVCLKFVGYLFFLLSTLLSLPPPVVLAITLPAAAAASASQSCLLLLLLLVSSPIILAKDVAVVLVVTFWLKVYEIQSGKHQPTDDQKLYCSICVCRWWGEHSGFVVAGASSFAGTIWCRTVL